jgi:hypothetical protein
MAVDPFWLCDIDYWLLIINCHAGNGIAAGMRFLAENRSRLKNSHKSCPE